MQKQFKIMLLIAFAAFPYMCIAQSNKKADKQTAEWRYEIEVVGVGSQGTYQIKVWSYSKNSETAIEQAKKNAVHGIVFKGFPGKDRLPGQKALVNNPTLEQKEVDFFTDFFKTGGEYQKFIALFNNGAIAPGDRIKIGKEYKVAVVVSVNVAALRKNLEDAGIIKGLGSGF